MSLTPIKKLLKPEKTYKVAGFVQKIRDHGKLLFVILRDREKAVQLVVDSPKLIEKFRKITKESVVLVEGVLKEPPTKLSKEVIPYELHVKRLKVYSKAAKLPFEIYPLQKVSLDKRLTYRWIDLRRPEKILIFKVWTVLEHAFRSFLMERGFIQIHPPKLMPSISETKEELFYLDYFGQTAYLAQSAQFYKQMAICAGFEKFFHIGPVFRATWSFTTRHDTEFTQYDVEMAFTSYEQLMRLEEELIVYMLQEIKEKLGEEIDRAYGVKIKIPTLPFPTYTLQEVKEILKHFPVKVRKEGDLSPEEEKILGEYIFKKHKHAFVFVTDYPAKTRAFYHKQHAKKPGITRSFDLLFKGLEITTGSEREYRIKRLIKQAKEHGVDIKSIEQYLEFFRYGVPPHAGFGFGPSRFIMQLLGLSSVKEATFVYRGPKRLRP